jgi:tRNA (guanosine-2'-O-)-methyltransferase
MSLSNVVGKSIDKIAMGAQKWVDINAFDSISNCVDTLKSKGYQIIATTHMIMIVYWRILTLQNRALCSLVQRDGLSEEILQRADGFLKFPWWVLQKV